MDKNNVSQDTELGADAVQDDPTNMSFSDIFKQLVLNGEIILSIPSEEYENLRKGLSQFKAKQNARLKEANLRPDNQILTYNILTDTETPEGINKVHIMLKDRIGITVLKMELPDSEI